MPDRRKILKLLGVAGIALAGTGPIYELTSSGDRTRLGDSQQYDRVVNLVDAGADDSGEEPIDEVLDDVLVDDTRVLFPPGTYRVEGFERGRLERVALVGEDATLVPRAGMTDTMVTLGGRDVTIDGFTFDYTFDETAPQVIISCSDGLAFENCLFRGVADVWGGRGHSDHQYHFMPEITDPDGEGLVRNVTLADGSASPSNRGGIWIGSDHRGTLTFDRVRLARWANNSLYVSGGSGSVIVRNSSFLNNCVSGPRFGNATARVENTSVVADGWVPVQGFSDAQESRGIWLNVTCESASIEDCEFVMTGPYAADGVVYDDWSGRPEWTARNGTDRDTTLDVVGCSFVLKEELKAISADGANVTTRDNSISRP